MRCDAGCDFPLLAASYFRLCACFLGTVNFGTLLTYGSVSTAPVDSGQRLVRQMMVWRALQDQEKKLFKDLLHGTMVGCAGGGCGDEWRWQLSWWVAHTSSCC